MSIDWQKLKNEHAFLNVKEKNIEGNKGVLKNLMKKLIPNTQINLVNKTRVEVRKNKYNSRSVTLNVDTPPKSRKRR